MRYRDKIIIGMAAAAGFCLVSSCTGSAILSRDTSLPLTQAPTPATLRALSVDPAPMIGEPYQVAGRTYTPQTTVSYDEVGNAYPYGPEMEGKVTTLGEAFLASKISGAHKTLPLPSYVEVTALDTGRTILVRINDRGPFHNDRLINLSAAAVAQLGLDQTGSMAVRVRKVSPPEAERALLRDGGTVAERIPTPQSLLKILKAKLGSEAIAEQASAQSAPVSKKTETALNKAPAGLPKADASQNQVKPIAETKEAAKRPTVSPGSLMVQVGAFSNRAGAEAVAKRLGAAIFTAGRMNRVRLGPYSTRAEANKGLAQARAKGYSDARLVRAE